MAPPKESGALAEGWYELVVGMGDEEHRTLGESQETYRESALLAGSRDWGVRGLVRGVGQESEDCCGRRDEPLTDGA